jgi:hypothetical protein
MKTLNYPALCPYNGLAEQRIVIEYFHFYLGTGHFHSAN